MKNKAYFIVPIVGVAIFAGVYFSFRSELEAEKTREQEAKEKARIQKREDDIAKQKAANAFAIEQQDLRKKQKAEREAMLAAEAAAREALNDARQKAYDDQNKFAQSVDRLNKDLNQEKEALQKLEEQRQTHELEQKFLKEYVVKAEANRKQLEDLMNKVEATARIIEQQRAAEAAAKSKS